MEEVMNQTPTAEKSRFSLRYSERRWLLVVPDLLILNGVMAASAVAIYAHTTGVMAGLPRVIVGLVWSAVLSTIWLTLGVLVEIFNLRKATNPLRSAFEVGIVTLIATLIFSLTPGISPALPTRRIYLFFFPLFATAALVLWRIIYGLIFLQPIFSRRAIIVGVGKSANALLAALPRIGAEPVDGEYAGVGYQIAGFVAADEDQASETLNGLTMLGNTSDLPAIVRQQQPDELIIAIDQSELLNGNLVESIIEAREQGIDVTMMLDMFERITGRIPVTHIGSNIHVILPIQRPTSYRFYQFARRLLDIVVGLIGCIIMGLLIPIIWVANRLTDPGDLFFRHQRAGKGGKPFEMIKFRSMLVDTSQFSDSLWTEADDPRITPVGRAIRKVRVDEIPQFWNILRGDMSLIGPRPESISVVEELVKQIPFYRARHAVKPGLTGWAQVNFGYGASVDDSRMKLEYDLFYIKNQTLYLDIRTIIKTVAVVLGMHGR